jgi:hypothetical protein
VQILLAELQQALQVRLKRNTNIINKFPQHIFNIPQALLLSSLLCVIRFIQDSYEVHLLKAVKTLGQSITYHTKYLLLNSLDLYEICEYDSLYHNKLYARLNFFLPKYLLKRPFLNMILIILQ